MDGAIRRRSRSTRTTLFERTRAAPATSGIFAVLFSQRTNKRLFLSVTLPPDDETPPAPVLLMKFGELVDSSIDQDAPRGADNQGRGFALQVLRG